MQWKALSAYVLVFEIEVLVFVIEESLLCATWCFIVRWGAFCCT